MKYVCEMGSCNTNSCAFPECVVPESCYKKETQVSDGQYYSSNEPFGVAIHVDKSKTYTTVMLTGDRYVGIGTSKRNPVDPYDRQVGVDIAMARALREIADFTENGAHG